MKNTDSIHRRFNTRYSGYPLRCRAWQTRLAVTVGVIAVGMTVPSLKAGLVVQGSGESTVAFQAETTVSLKTGTPENWVVKADGSASGGAALYADGTNDTASSPHSFAQYQIRFAQAGTYYLHYRWRADATRTGGDAFTANSSWIGNRFGAFSVSGSAAQGDFVRSKSNDAQAPADNDYAWTHEPAAYTISAADLSAPVTLTIGTREAGMFFDRFVFSTDPDLGASALDAIADSQTDVVIQGSGDSFLAFEAEVKAHFTAGTPENWVVKSDPAASGGGAIYSDGTNDTGTSPHSFAQFQVQFAKAGTYYLHYRWRADAARTGGDAFTANSSWIGNRFGAFSSAGSSAQADYVRSKSNDAQAPADNDYAWIHEPAAYTVTASDLSAPLVLTIGTREAGMYFDRFVFSPDPDLSAAALDALVNSGSRPPTPEVASISGNATLSSVIVKFTRPLASASVTANGFKFTPPLVVSSAAVDPSDSRNVLLTTASQAEGTRYTVAITGVKDASGTPVAANTTASFSAWKRVDGWATKEIFFAVPGGTVAELTASAGYVAGKPDRLQWVKGFQLNQDPLTDNYGARLTAFFQPAESGVYELFTNNDDEAELQLSSDSSASKLVSLGTFPLTPAFAEGNSVATPNLTAGSRYLLTGLLKQGTGDVYFNVAARRVGENTPALSLRALSGAQISTYVNPDAGVVTFKQQPANATAPANSRATFRVKVEAPVSPIYFQWQRNGIDIPGAVRSTFTTPVLSSKDGGALYRCVVSAAGIDTPSAVATLTVTAGSPSSQQPFLGINFIGGGTAGGASLGATDVAGVVPQENWNNLAGNTLDGVSLSDASGASTPVTLTTAQASEVWYTGTIATGDADGALFQGFIGAGASHDPLQITLNGVPAGKYQLIVYSIGFDFAAAYNTAFSVAGGAAYPTVHGKSETGLPYQNAPAFRRMTSTVAGSPSPGNFVEFDGVSPAADGSLSLSAAWESTEAGNGHQPAINAIQLVRVVDVPKPIALGIPVLNGGNLILNWSGGVAPFRVQFKSSATGQFSDLGTVNTSSYTVTGLGNGGFFRIVDGTGL